MKLLSFSGFIAATVLICSATASAQYRPYDPYNGDRRVYRDDGYRDDRYRDDRYGNYGYGNNGRYSSGTDLIRMVEAHVQRAGSGGFFRGGDRNRADKALRSLSDFDRELSRNRFDRHALDKAIEHVSDLARHSPDYRQRSLLENDANRLRDFRASAGNYSGGRHNDYGYRR